MTMNDYPDSTVSLCLTCSCSLPPRKPLASPTSSKSAGKLSPTDEIFLTKCCRRPICPSCIRVNPRLARYNPCLRCLGGVGAVSAANAAVRSPSAALDLEGLRSPRVNVDGGVRDEDLFVLGDDEDEIDGGGSDAEGCQYTGSTAPDTPPPAYSAVSPLRGVPAAPRQGAAGPPPPTTRAAPPKPPANPGPKRYYIRPTDTLVGIALRYNVDGRLLCRLNGLPPSTLRTTPHLLHTRTHLVVPASARGADLASTSDGEPDTVINRPTPEEEARRARERAEGRFRALTKEADWRIARAYVAVAGAEDGVEDAFREDEVKKAREVEVDGGTAKLDRVHSVGTRDDVSGVEGRAIDRYLDDEDWERRQLGEGRAIQIPAFPLFRDTKRLNLSGTSDHRKTWWK